MPHLNQTGPEGKGKITGRKLGECNPDSTEPEFELGQGMGKKRRSGEGKGLGKRLQSSKIFNQLNT